MTTGYGEKPRRRRSLPDQPTAERFIRAKVDGRPAAADALTSLGAARLDARNDD
ncbi:hypothetical protein [Amycolatopsis stemonae]